MVRLRDGIVEALQVCCGAEGRRSSLGLGETTRLKKDVNIWVMTGIVETRRCLEFACKETCAAGYVAGDSFAARGSHVHLAAGRLDSYGILAVH